MRGMRNRLASALLTTAITLILTSCAGSLEQKPPPSTAPTASPSPTAKPTGPIAIPSNWIHYSWAAAGFSVRLPSKPKQATALRSVRRIPITLRVALVAESPGPIEVGVAQLGVPLTPAGVGAELQASVKRFAESTGGTLVSAKATKFRGMRARKGIIARGTQNFELLVFQRDPTHEVFVLASEGEVFDAVTTSLKLQ